MGFEGIGMLSKFGGINVKKGGDDAMDMDMDNDFEDEKRKDKGEDYAEEEDEGDDATRLTPIRGPIPSKQGCWGSCVRLVDPANSCSTLDCLEMNRNEAALCCASVRFHSYGGEPLLAVATVTDLTMPLSITRRVM
jgi:splicing factor 3B subunit 3